MLTKLEKQSSPNFLNFLPKPDERTIIFGMTGSGKTFLAEKILRWRKYVIVYDLKGTIRWKGYRVVTSMQSLLELDPEKYPKIIFKPPPYYEYEKEPVDEFFNWVYQRGNCTLYIDEVMTTCFRGQISKPLLTVMTRGRELGVSFIGASQRPKQIPQSIITESEHRFIFLLTSYQDAKRIEENYRIDADEIVNLPKRYFYYSSVDKTYFKPFTLSEK